MSNETTQKRSLSVSLGAAFLMATSAIGPGFLTQTSQFTAKYLSSFAFVIVCVIIMDMIAPDQRMVHRRRFRPARSGDCQ